jgi:hypothetical protein
MRDLVVVARREWVSLSSSPRVFVDITARQNGINKYFAGFNSE